MSAKILKSTTIDDRDANVTYAGANWTVHTGVQSIFHLWGNSDTFSDVQSATATVKFYGNTIEYWGNTGPYHGPCLVSVDGYPMITVNSHADADGYPVLLYSQTNLTVGDHQLQIKVVNPSYPNVCEVDRFVANITSGTGTGSSDNGGYNGGGSDSNTTNGVGKKGIPMAAIAGAAAGAAVLCILFLLWLYLRSKKRNATRPGRIDISKPLLFDGVPSSPPPQSPNFTHAYNHPVSYASSSSPPVSSYNPYTSGSPSIGGSGAFNPSNYNQGTHTNPALSSMGSMPLPPGTHASTSGPASILSSGSDVPTMSYYNSAKDKDRYVANQDQHDQQRPISHAWTPDQAHAQYQNAMPAAPSAHSENTQYAPRSEKAAYSGAGTAAVSGSGSGSGSAGAAILPAPELPPPAYDD